MDDALFQDFVDLSSAITGFSAFHLHGTGQARAYFDAVTRVVGESTVADLLAASRRARDAGGADEASLDLQLRREIFSDDRLGPIARNLVKLWFIGTWYQLPAEWRDAYGVREHDTTFVVSPDSYVEGLLWPTIGANPSGAKGPGWGTWAEPPRIPEI